MSETFTASGLAAKLEELDLGTSAETIRVIRHYSNEGLLKPIGAVNTGTGRRRTYRRTDVLKAAILLRLNRLGIPVGVIKELFNGLDAFIKAELSTNFVDAVETKLKRPCLVLSIPGSSPRRPPRLLEYEEAHASADDEIIILGLSRYRSAL